MLLKNGVQLLNRPAAFKISFKIYVKATESMPYS